MQLTTSYLTAWPLLLGAAVVLVARDPGRYALTRPCYWRFLFEWWKFASFLLAMLLIAVAAPYSGDPTWDLTDSVLISIAVYLTAPWCIGAAYREVVARRVGSVLFVAVVLFFVPCWTYDTYILWRNGHYPATWLSNLALSGGVCLLAGLFWNLGWRAGESSLFTFRWHDWPPAARTPFRKVLVFAITLSLPVVVLVGVFVYDYLTTAG